MNKIVISNVSLSGNPTAKTVESVDGINGKLNQASDGALYCVVTLEDQSNPTRFVKRVIAYRQQKNSQGQWAWRGATPKVFLGMKSRSIDGRSTTHNVEPYDVSGRTVSTYTTIVLTGENEATVFANAGHPIVAQAAEVGVMQPDASLLGS
jgi:hypothetical protein